MTCFSPDHHYLLIMDFLVILEKRMTPRMVCCLNRRIRSAPWHLLTDWLLDRKERSIYWSISSRGGAATQSLVAPSIDPAARSWSLDVITWSSQHVALRWWHGRVKGCFRGIHTRVWFIYLIKVFLFSPQLHFFWSHLDDRYLSYFIINRLNHLHLFIFEQLPLTNAQSISSQLLETSWGSTGRGMWGQFRYSFNRWVATNSRE